LNELQSVAKNAISADFKDAGSPFPFLNGRVIKSFDRPFLSVAVPSESQERVSFEARIGEFLKALSPVIWGIEEILNPREYRVVLEPVIRSFPDLHCEGFRRSIMHGLFIQLYDIFANTNLNYTNKEKRLLGTMVIEGVRVVNEIIPENFFESAQLDPLESRRFKFFISRCIAYGWLYDFYPSIQVLEELRYIDTNDEEPLLILIKEKHFRAALKMIETNSVKLVEGSKSWIALIESKDSTEKFEFVNCLLSRNVLSMSWELKGLNFIHIAIKCREGVLDTIVKCIKLCPPIGINCTEYLKFARQPSIVSRHSAEYQQRLEQKLQTLINAGY